MSFSIAVNFNGNCREAVTFYAEVFEQSLPHFLTYSQGDTSLDPNFKVSEKMKNWVMYTSLNILGTSIDFSDMPDTFEFIRGNSMALTVMFADSETAKKTFDSLSGKGQVAIPFSAIQGQGFYGMVGDQFGINWVVKAN